MQFQGRYGTVYNVQAKLRGKTCMITGCLLYKLTNIKYPGMDDYRVFTIKTNKHLVSRDAWLQGV